MSGADNKVPLSCQEAVDSDVLTRGEFAQCIGSVTPLARTLIMALVDLRIAGNKSAASAQQDAREARSTTERREWEDGDGRWEVGFRNIVTVLGGARESFEIKEVVEVVRVMTGGSPQGPTPAWWKPSQQDDDDNVFDWLETELSAVDCVYRGSPTYDHDAYWFREKAIALVAEARKVFGQQVQADAGAMPVAFWNPAIDHDSAAFSYDQGFGYNTPLYTRPAQVQADTRVRIPAGYVLQPIEDARAAYQQVQADAGAVAWSYEGRQPFTDPVRWAEFFSRTKPKEIPQIRNVRPLYLHPVAESDKRDEIVRNATAVVKHWNEFGPEYDFERAMRGLDDALEAIKNG